MNKRKLIAKLNELVDTMNSLNREIVSLRRENDELRAAIALFENNSVAVKNVEIKPEADLSQQGFTVNTEVLENAVEVAEEVETAETEAVVLQDNSMEYGSQIIGKIIVESAKFANSLSESAGENKKELVNLIMGKAEVAKAEIFNIATSDMADENKKEMIDSQLQEATDYFKSVAAQI